jgi:hypothetical protein
MDAKYLYLLNRQDLVLQFKTLLRGLDSGERSLASPTLRIHSQRNPESIPGRAHAWGCDHANSCCNAYPTHLLRQDYRHVLRCMLTLVRAGRASQIFLVRAILCPPSFSSNSLQLSIGDEKCIRSGRTFGSAGLKIDSLKQWV